MTGVDWTHELVEQIDWHWREQARPRLAGLTDEEYLWEPVPGAWTIRPRTRDDQPGTGPMTIDWVFPPPEPAPVTTIAWRLGHVIVGVLAARTASHFGGQAADHLSWRHAATADMALTQLDDAYAAWLAGVRRLDAAALARPCGPAEGPWGDLPMATLVLHIHRELIHHLAEIALLRDLWAHRG